METEYAVEQIEIKVGEVLWDQCCSIPTPFFNSVFNNKYILLASEFPRTLFIFQTQFAPKIKLNVIS